jgi:3',5'-cyclic-AMP phosphodiesterase
MTHAITRRKFFGRLIAGLSLLAAGCSKKYMGPIRGSDKGAVRLVFYTDVHARVQGETPAAMAKAAHAVNAQHADLVIAGGDLITDGFTSSPARSAPRWDAYMGMHHSITADLYPAIGNHDLVGADPKDGTLPSVNPRAVYLDRMGLDRTYYSYDAVGYHFVILDAIQVTGDRYQYRGIVGPEQLAWFREDLGKIPRGTPIVLVTHIPLLSAFHSATSGAATVPKKNQVVVNNCDVLGIFKNHNVILVLQGHLHVKETIRWQNTTFLCGGAICGNWWRGPRYGTQEGFSVIKLTGDHMDYQYIGYGWTARRP